MAHAEIVQQYNSCVACVREYVPSLPRLDAEWFAVFPRSSPAIGNVAIFHYKKTDTWHIAHIYAYEESCFWVHECNYIEGEKGVRCVKYDDPSLVGFWEP